MLYAFGAELPELRWGHSDAVLDPQVIERMGLKKAKRLGEVGARGGGTDSPARIHTPIMFRDLLLRIARSANMGTVSNKLRQAIECVNCMKGVVDDIGPQIGKVVLQDYERLNRGLILAEKVLDYPRPDADGGM